MEHAFAGTDLTAAGVFVLIYSFQPHSPDKERWVDLKASL